MGNNADKILFDNNSRVAPLGLIAMDGAKELGEKVNWYLTNWANENEYAVDTFLIEADCPRFQSGDGKGLIKQTVRGKDLFIICDMANYSCTYKMFGKECAMSSRRSLSGSQENNPGGKRQGSPHKCYHAYPLRRQTAQKKLS